MSLIPDPPNTTPVPAFDLGAEPPTAPEGSTALPPSMVWEEAAPLPAEWFKSAAAPVDVDLSAPSPEWMLEIRTLPAAQQEVVLAWWPLIWGKQSEFLEGKYVMSLSALLMHASAYQEQFTKAQKSNVKEAVVKRRAERAQHKEKDQEYALRYAAWQEDCAARNRWIDAKREQWKARVEEARQAMLVWSTYVEQARTDYKNAKATQAPPRPER